MTRHLYPVICAAFCIVAVGAGLAAQERTAVTSPNGISFAAFTGFDAWPVIAPSRSDGVIKVTLGNPLMIKTYAEGFPANGRAVPDGAAMAKIAWSTIDNPLLPGAAMVPDALMKVQFMVKDTARFPDTNGWGYADFTYDAASKAFTAIGNGPAFAKAACHQCHTRVQTRDFVFTAYAPR